MATYTSNALDGFDKADVLERLLEDRLSNARDDLEDAREAVKALCEPVGHEIRQLTCVISADLNRAMPNSSKANEPRRLNLYKMTSTLIRCFASVANELEEAGYRC